MVAVTLMWSIAGVVTRHLEAARSFEVTFWRSSVQRRWRCWCSCRCGGPRGVRARSATAGAPLWVSGLCWSVMFTAFMVALTLTTVANVLVTMALGPLLTALLARVFLGHRLPARTWGAIVVAGRRHRLDVRHASSAQGAAARHAGRACACRWPGACNWTVLQHAHAQGHDDRHAAGGADRRRRSRPLSTLPLAWPLQASAHDLGLLALLGVVQLAIPCLLSVVCARVLTAPEVVAAGAARGDLRRRLGLARRRRGAGIAACSAAARWCSAALVLNEWLGWRARLQLA